MGSLHFPQARTFPCISRRMVSVTLRPPSETLTHLSSKMQLGVVAQGAEGAGEEGQMGPRWCHLVRGRAHVRGWGLAYGARSRLGYGLPHCWGERRGL